MTRAELYVVATPLGNREDITLRAIETLRRNKWIFAEDTREALKLLELCGVPAQGKKIQSYASHNLKRATEQAVRLLQEGESVVLATDRGTPGISDPGALLVAAARDAGIRVVPIPGASAVTTLLSVSGVTESEFIFLGFLPKELKKREELFARVAQWGAVSCFYESPRRIRETMEELKTAFPSGEVLIGREMTKLHEEYVRVPLTQVTATVLPEQGEYSVLLFPGAPRIQVPWEEEIALRVGSDRDWSKAVASRYGVAAKEMYNALQHARAKPL